jgi:hypothetical protein
MIIFRIFGSLARLTAMLAAGTFLLAAADNASAKDGVAEVPAALNPDKLSIFRVVSATGVQVYTCTRNAIRRAPPAGSSRDRTHSCSIRKTGPSASTMPDRPGKVSTAASWSAR